MIRILTIALALLAITVLLASSFATLFSGEEPAVDTNTGNDAERGQATATDSATNGRGSRPVLPKSVFLASANSDAIASTRSTLSRQALATQVSNQLQEYADGLDGGSERAGEILQALSQAYQEAAALAANPDLSNTQNRDPNYVVNAMAELLDAEELTELELFLETSSKRQFLDTYSSSLEIVSPTLSSNIKQLLLDTFFTEHYAATNPHGSLVPANSTDFLVRQMDAIRLTQDQLRGTLPASEFTLVDNFLAQQAAGIDLALSLFQQGN